MTSSAAGAPSLGDFQSIVGEPHARPGGSADALDDVTPAVVVEPGSVEEICEVVRLAGRAGLALVARGAGTKMGCGNPPSRLDVVLHTRRLNRLLEHSAGDLVVRAQAGMPIADLQRELAPAHQMLAFDPPHAGATLGGIVAADASGPQRLRYGTARDWRTPRCGRGSSSAWPRRRARSAPSAWCRPGFGPCSPWRPSPPESSRCRG